MYFKILSLCIGLGGLSGCGTFTPREIAEPSKVTVREAVFEVATTLRDVQDLVPENKRAGLIADEVTVVFNVAAASAVTDAAKLTVSNVPLAGGAIGGDASAQNVSDAKRGNQITIKFKNFATADMSKGAFTLSGAGGKDAKASNGKQTGSATGPNLSYEQFLAQLRAQCRANPGMCLFNIGIDAKTLRELSGTDKQDKQ
ncbi:hypothetical protein [Sinorhizobium terangae]|uniref:hypothetical protein n=1 Tax=Sinorhizobium terangae TaxID=110322 RepID=UPI0024B03C60|nr:hypothetical protein [Sinorhizobium terangae]WFU49110.1 hypothetical protein QA637_06835 [Sinorhizobium terangae]